MKLVPTGNYLLAKKINENDEVYEKGIFFQKEEFPEYQIIQISQSIEKTDYKVNDVVVINSKSTAVNMDDQKYYLINIDNVIGKVN